jgi:hypothetical protein
MAKRIKIEFLDNPTPTVDVIFGINYTPYSQTIDATIGVDVVIGATKEDTASNLFDYYDALTLPSWLSAFTTITLATNIIYFDFEPADDSLLTFFRVGSTQSSITIEEVDIPAGGDFEIGLVRSTLSARIIPNVNFDTATLDLYNWSGDIVNVPTSPSYSLSKPVVQLGQQVVNFDINELSKTGIFPTIANYTLSGLQTIPFEQSCWSYYVANCYDGEDLVYTKDGTYLCLYGYGYFQDLFNPQPESNILIVGNNHTHIRAFDNRVHFLTKDLTTLTVNGTPVTVTANTDLNYQNVFSINLNDYDASANTLTLVFTYPTETRTLIFTVKEECKYDVVNCVFINKYGLPQSLFFTKAQKRSDEIESSEYRGLISEFGVYNTTEHLYKTFNSNGRTKLSCNTDYLNESENETFRQLMLSEQVWLIESGVINPVSLDKKTIEYKTSLVDKLIQYSLDFKYAFDIINQC